ncbi:MAG: glycosyltransferase [Ilumatobacteraceae bacterium]
MCTNPTYLEETAHLWTATLIPNGVDVDRFVPGPGDRCAFDLPGDVPIVLMVSAAIASKRVEAGIRAVAQLPDAMLVVAGDGVLRHELDTLGQKLLGSRYRRLTVSADRMPDLYRCADAFLHLSSDESFGNVYVEALVSGLPCVVHDYDLTRWIYDGAATLVDATDESTIVAGLRTALRAGPPTSEIVAAAHARFSWATIADRYREFFQRVLETTAATSEISA